MNCANHPDKAVAKYCRTCGKPLCQDCVREVMGIAYCESCLAERVTGSAPSSPYTAPVAPVVVASSGPNPGLAGILGAIPFGVGAVYNGQYAKGLAHLVIFILLVIGANNAHDPFDWICGVGIAAFIFYQIIDAVKTAKAISAGEQPPDPLGLNTMFSPGDRDASRGIPTGAVLLIGLGILFLLHNLDLPFVNAETLWSIFLLAIGVWLFVKRRITPNQRFRSLTGPVLLITIGGLWLIASLHGPSGWKTWPVALLVIGVLKLVERGYLGGGHPPAVPPTSGRSYEQQPPTEVNSEVKNG